MIKKLREIDRSKLMEYVGREPAINLFIIGDVENFGMDCDMQELWGDFSEDGKYRGVLLRYKQFFVVYADGEYDKKGFAEVIKSFENTEVISGKEDIILGLKEYLPYKEVKGQFFSEMKKLEERVPEKEQEILKKLKGEDAEKLFDLVETIEEFNMSTSTVEDTRSRIESEAGRSYGVEIDGELVAVASTTAENSMSAMVVGVCTREGYRKKGYASKCVSMICEELLSEGKSLCLFYDNPKAGSIYKRLGFKEIGRWMMMKL